MFHDAVVAVRKTRSASPVLERRRSFSNPAPRFRIEEFKRSFSCPTNPAPRFRIEEFKRWSFSCPTPRFRIEEFKRRSFSYPAPRFRIEESNYLENIPVDDFDEVTLDVPSDAVAVEKTRPTPILDQRWRFSRRQMSMIRQRSSLIRQNSEELITRRSIQKRKKKLMQQRRKAREIYREALHNTRDTITLVAILISTFAYTAGVNPPGGVHQEGPLIGTSVAARKTAFRVFSVCNNVALFTSLCVVLVLVSIIPFKRKALMRMLATAHKAIWVAVSFMATAYVAAAVVIMQPPPRRRGMDWTTVFLLSICAGSLGTVFVGLGIMLIKHRIMKINWRKQHASQRAREQAREKLVEKSSSENDGSSTISDMAISISRELGYHSY